MNLIEKLEINPDYKEFMTQNLQEQIVLMKKKIDSDFYPAPENIFKFLISDPKVVIIGQDPYATPNLATGVGFATESGKRLPPSLRCIIESLERHFGETLIEPSIDNIGSKLVNFDTTLSHWMTQGVMIMNSALTVKAYNPGSHIDIWEKFIRNLILHIDITYKPKWVLLGKVAQNYSDILPNAYIDAHPASNSYSNKIVFKGDFFKNIKEIKWI